MSIFRVMSSYALHRLTPSMVSSHQPHAQSLPNPFTIYTLNLFTTFLEKNIKYFLTNRKQLFYNTL